MWPTLGFFEPFINNHPKSENQSFKFRPDRSTLDQQLFQLLVVPFSHKLKFGSHVVSINKHLEIRLFVRFSHYLIRTYIIFFPSVKSSVSGQSSNNWRQGHSCVWAEVAKVWFINPMICWGWTLQTVSFRVRVYPVVCWGLRLQTVSCNVKVNKCPCQDRMWMYLISPWNLQSGWPPGLSYGRNRFANNLPN